MAKETAGELEKRAREFMVKWDSDHWESDDHAEPDVDMLTEFARATAQAIERMLRERIDELEHRTSGCCSACELSLLADQIRKEYQE